MPRSHGSFVRNLLLITMLGFASTRAAAQALPADAGAAAAGPVDDKAAKKQAAKDAAEGQKLLKKKSFAEAVPKLEAAYAADPKPATLLALAEAQAGAAQTLEAYRSYEKLLQTHGAELKPKDRGTVDAAMAVLARATGTVRLSVSEPDARLNIDGRDVAAAEAAQPIRLLPGKHQLAIAKVDFDLLITSVEVEGGKEAAVDAKLKREVKTGHVRVTAPAVAEGDVVVDEKTVGRLPWDGDLPPGKHVIDVKGAGLTSDPQTVDVVAKADLSVELATRPLPPPVAPVPGPTGSATPGAAMGSAMPEAAMPPPVAVEVTPAVTAAIEPTATLTATAEAPAARPDKGGVRIGLMLGLITIPRPVQAELTAKLGRHISLGAQYSMLPDITPPGFDAGLKLAAYQGVARFFPFGGSFYIGSGIGYQQLKASLGHTDMASGDRSEVSCDMSGLFVSPQLGWLWVWKSGFALGLNIGAQIPLPKDPVVKTTINGIEIPESAGDEDTNDMRDKVKTIAKVVAKYPVPNLDLLKLGFFF